MCIQRVNVLSYVWLSYRRYSCVDIYVISIRRTLHLFESLTFSALATCMRVDVNELDREYVRPGHHLWRKNTRTYTVPL